MRNALAAAACLFASMAAGAQVSDTARACRWHLVESLPDLVRSEPDPSVRQVLLLFLADALKGQASSQASELSAQLSAEARRASVEAIRRLQSSNDGSQRGILQRQYDSFFEENEPIGGQGTSASFTASWRAVSNEVLELSAKGPLSPNLVKEIESRFLPVMDDPRFAQNVLNATGMRTPTFREADDAIILLERARNALPTDRARIGDQLLRIAQGIRSVRRDDENERTWLSYDNVGPQFLVQMLAESGHPVEAEDLRNWVEARSLEADERDRYKQPPPEEAARIENDNQIGLALKGLDKNDLGSRLLLIQRFQNDYVRDFELSEFFKARLEDGNLELALSVAYGYSQAEARVERLLQIYDTFENRGETDRARGILDAIRQELVGGKVAPFQLRALWAGYLRRFVKWDRDSVANMEMALAVQALDQAFLESNWKKADGKVDIGALHDALFETLGPANVKAHPLAGLFEALLSGQARGDAETAVFYAEGFTHPVLKSAALISACKQIVDREPKVWTETVPTSDRR